jgi:aspartate/methionine/tyrosine aminotransferase
MRDRTVTIDSMGKTFSVTGWKVGWAIAAAPLSSALRATHQFVTFTSSAPFQEALADTLAYPAAQAFEDYYTQLRSDYGRRRGLLTRILDDAGLTPLPIAGSYFLLSNVGGLGFADDGAFCRHLCTEIGVAAIPTSAFYTDPSRAPMLARFCFAKRDETIQAAADRLAKLRPLH